jgi:hypothetical protein
VVAKNSVGSSPPSKIASMEIPNGEYLRQLRIYTNKRKKEGRRKKTIVCMDGQLK